MYRHKVGTYASVQEILKRVGADLVSADLAHIEMFGSYADVQIESIAGTLPAVPAGEENTRS